jgi:hypothetical protein
MTDDSCRASSLLPGWSRGHVLAHWARNADGQTRMLLAALRGEVAAQYPGGDAQREADIETAAARPFPLILQDVRAAVDRVEDAWRQMPSAAWSRPTGARGRHWPLASTTATTSDDPVVVRGAASALLCWLVGRPVPATADLTASRSGRHCPLPQLRPWS